MLNCLQCVAQYNTTMTKFATARTLATVLPNGEEHWRHSLCLNYGRKYSQEMPYITYPV